LRNDNIADEEEHEETASPPSPYNTRSAQQARKQDEAKVIASTKEVVFSSALVCLFVISRIT